ncbi:13413_t:CDS:2 [Entrophospora sp. SA101]|nr:13413_t:CDS:2 [Entrophospora sp. SA101]
MAAITQNITTPAPVTSVASLTETYSLIRIGSDPKSDLVISNSNPAEPVIAKTHCWLELRRLNNKNRTVFHNGPNKRTYVEGKLMEPHQQYLLKDGDRILVKCKDGYIGKYYDDCDNKIETMLLIKKKNILFTNKLINSKNPILKQEELKNYKDELKLIKSVDCGRVLSLADQHFDDDSVVQVHFQKRAIQYNIRPLQCIVYEDNSVVKDLSEAAS